MVGTTAVYLNETGYLVWCLCGENRTIGKIIALLEEAYPEQREYIRDDVISVINHLVENGVIVLNNE
ncbi:MAG: PqqD family protein [Desulfobacterales bacterium]